MKVAISRQSLSRRLRFWRDVFWRPWAKAVGAIYGVLGALDFMLDRVPERFRDTFDWWPLVPDLSWQTWLNIGLTLSLVIALEGAYRLHQANQDTVDERVQLRQKTALVAMARVEAIKLMDEKIDAAGLDTWRGRVEAWYNNTAPMISQNFDASVTVRFAQPPTGSALRFSRAINSEHNNWLLFLHYRIELMDKLGDQLQRTPLANGIRS